PLLDAGKYLSLGPGHDVEPHFHCVSGTDTCPTHAESIFVERCELAEGVGAQARRRLGNHWVEPLFRTIPSHQFVVVVRNSGKRLDPHEHLVAPPCPGRTTVATTGVAATLEHPVGGLRGIDVSHGVGAEHKAEPFIVRVPAETVASTGADSTDIALDPDVTTQPLPSRHVID